MGGNIQQLFRGMMLITFSAHLDKSFGYLNALVDSAIHQSIEHNLPASTTNIRGPAVAESANPASRYQQNRSPTRTIALENMHVNPNEQYNNPRTINTLSCADGVFLNGVGNVPNSQRIFESARSLSDYKIGPRLNPKTPTEHMITKALHTLKTLIWFARLPFLSILLTFHRHQPRENAGDFRRSTPMEITTKNLTPEDWRQNIQNFHRSVGKQPMQNF